MHALIEVTQARLDIEKEATSDTWCSEGATSQAILMAIERENAFNHHKAFHGMTLLKVSHNDEYAKFLNLLTANIHNIPSGTHFILAVYANDFASSFWTEMHITVGAHHEIQMDKGESFLPSVNKEKKRTYFENLSLPIQKNIMAQRQGFVFLENPTLLILSEVLARANAKLVTSFIYYFCQQLEYRMPQKSLFSIFPTTLASKLKNVIENLETISQTKSTLGKIKNEILFHLADLYQYCQASYPSMRMDLERILTEQNELLSPQPVRKDSLHSKP